MLETRFTAEYGVEFPIVSAGMAFVSRARLAAAVSGAGGFGIVGAGAMPPHVLRAEIDAVRAVTDRPFGINLLPRFAAREHIEVCLERDVPVVTFFWDDPPADWVRALDAGGVRVWIQVGSPTEAEAAVALGAAAVIAQGTGAGGHNRSVAGTISIVPAVVDAIAPTPVLAAGGLADGRGLVAALALGADAAVFGTRFLASEEADAHPEYKRRVLAAGVGDTAHTWVFGFDWPDAQVRGLRNALVSAWEGRDWPPPYRDLDAAEQPTVGATEVFGQELPLVRFMGLPPTAVTSGDLEQMSLLAGESAGLIEDLPPAAALVARLAEEARSVINDRLRD